MFEVLLFHFATLSIEIKIDQLAFIVALEHVQQVEKKAASICPMINLNQNNNYYICMFLLGSYYIGQFLNEIH